MYKPFVVISGLPASGKTTLARRLAPALNLPLIDKDDILDRLFELKGVGDAAWRRRLSRESDAILQHEATAASDGAILASLWRLHGMPSDSGTPTDWLQALSNHVVNVHCACELKTAANRFLQRQRHPGHLDGEASYTDVVASLRRFPILGHLDIAQRVHVDTSDEPKLDDVVREVRDALERCRTSESNCRR